MSQPPNTRLDQDSVEFDNPNLITQSESIENQNPGNLNTQGEQAPAQNNLRIENSQPQLRHNQTSLVTEGDLITENIQLSPQPKRVSPLSGNRKLQTPNTGFVYSSQKIKQSAGRVEFGQISENGNLQFLPKNQDVKPVVNSKLPAQKTKPTKTKRKIKTAIPSLHESTIQPLQSRGKGQKVTLNNNNSIFTTQFIQNYDQNQCSQKCKIFLIVIIVLLIIGGVVAGALVGVVLRSRGSNDNQFQYYCPTTTVNQIDTYLVFHRIEAVSDGKIKLTYCGLARPATKTCADAAVVCSIPGPIFSLPGNKPAYIVWINDINTNIELPDQDCYAKDSSNGYCSIDAKDPTKQNQSCTFQDPTYLRYKHYNMAVGKNNHPVNAHIHGIPIRPTMDGHPLAWYSNSGMRGPGFQSLHNSSYYSKNESIDCVSAVPELKGYKNFKVVQLESNQPPGFYFYHDHAMRSTKFNVKHGLSSLFIINDPNADKYLPQTQYQSFVIFSTTTLNSQSNQAGHQEVIYVINSTSQIQRGPTYMYKFLNGHYDNKFRNNSFAVYYKNHSNTIIEVDPTQNSDITQDMHLLSFSMIGADSSLFHKPINNITQFDLGEAQRVQILINFDSNHGVQNQVTKVYLLCFDQNLDQTVIKLTLPLQNPNQYNGVVINADQMLLNISTSYYDLSQITDSQIAVKRMSPLFSFPRDKVFSINGHYMMDMGASEKPRIGTTDWYYFINNMAEAHPIHIHLVNFQVSSKYELKLTDQGCTFYQLDYILSTGYPPYQNMSYSQLCKRLNQDIDEKEAHQLYIHLSKFHLQNITQIDSEIGTYSGFNVLQKITTKAEKQQYVASRQQNCNLDSVFKYLCKDASDTVPQYYKRWKDTALIEGYTVTVLMVRWAKNDYNPAVQAYPYFNIPEEQLIEYPGYVYHCHILPHEDNEMMRPFMMQPSDEFIKRNKNVSSWGKQSFQSWSGYASSFNLANNCRE